MFMYQLECKNTSMQAVCVVHKEEKEVQVTPLVEKGGVLQALIPIYTQYAQVFLIDKKGRRYLLSEEDKWYRLMHVEDLLDICYDMGSKNRKLVLYLWEKKKEERTVLFFPLELLKVFYQRSTRALPPPMSFSTSGRRAMEVSPGVVMARAPWAAPQLTALSRSL